MTTHRSLCVIGVAIVASCADTVAQDWRLLDGVIPASSSGAFVSGRNRVVSIGSAGETREWDGTRWLLRPLRHVPGSVFQQTFDSWRGVTVALAGNIPFTAPTQTWESDGAEWTLRSTPVAPPQLFGGGVAFDSARGRTVLFGGGFLPGNATWEWDGTTWQQRFPATVPPARSAPAMTFDAARGRTVLFGGHVINGFSTIPFGDTWEWDGTNWQQRFPTVSPSARTGQRLAFDTARQVTIMFGANGSLPAETWEYDGITWTQRAGLMPPVGAFPGLVYDSNRARTVAWQPVSAGAPGGVWEWDGSVWQQRLSDPSPASRFAPATAYSATRDRLVMFGGYVGNSAETWEWDGAAWAQRSPATSPPGRSQHSMWSDGSDVFVFGGGPSQSPHGNDTWRFDGTTWASAPSAILPPGRHSAAVAFDPTNGGALLFGGYQPSAVLTAYGDTWRWTATGWTQVVPTNAPSPRSNAAMAGDPLRQRVVLWGGQGNSGALDDTWEWDGTNWLLQNPVHRPPSGGARAMVFDATFGAIVLLTTISSLDAAVHTWVWTGADWWQLTTPTRVTAPVSIAATPGPASIRMYEGEHLFELNLVPPVVSSFGASCPTPGPRLLVDTWPRPGALDFALTSIGHPPHAPGLLLLGTTPANSPVGNCTAWVQLGGPTFAFPCDAFGRWDLPLPLPPLPALIGLRVLAQAWSLGTGQLAATNAIDVTIGR